MTFCVLFNLLQDSATNLFFQRHQEIFIKNRFLFPYQAGFFWSFFKRPKELVLLPRLAPSQVALVGDGGRKKKLKSVGVVS